VVAVAVLPILLMPEQSVEAFCPKLFFVERLSASEPALHSATPTLFTDGFSISATNLPSTIARNIGVLCPGDAFRDTKLGELSVTSCNLLAPYYHALALHDVPARLEFAQQDRSARFPLALKMAKQTNADFLLLQEIEGGPVYEPPLAQLLNEPVSDTILGYDSYLWVPLLPNKPDHPIGLCVAWRSEKHELVAHEGYKRGMVCQFREKQHGGDENSSSSVGTFALANVHLPARPNQILGRLVYMSKTVQTLAAMDIPTRASPLDGVLLVGGDWNCDQNSVTARLLTHGWVSPGNVRDRNYKATVSKAIAARMGHGYRFKDVYGDPPQLRQHYAPVTVSLHGRGPGCMDHLFYTQAPLPPTGYRQRSQPDGAASSPTLLKQQVNSITSQGKLSMSKRKVRREKATRLRRTSRGNTGSGGSFRPHVQVESVLATVAGSEDVERLALIHQGLPNVKHGFPSDHIPIGALFVPRSEFDMGIDSNQPKPTEISESDTTSQSALASSSFTSPGGISAGVQRRRDAGIQSTSVRRRHNLVLRTVADWLESSSRSSISVFMIRDQPLYKNPLTKDLVGLTKKSRAPDLVCILGDALVIVEISVVAKTKVESVVQQKNEKYKDLPTLLQSSSKIQEEGLMVVLDPVIIVLDDECKDIPESTVQATATLASFLYPKDPEAARFETSRLCQILQSLF
jgi:hypothetical protein